MEILFSSSDRMTWVGGYEGSVGKDGTQLHGYLPLQPHRLLLPYTTRHPTL